MLTEKQKESFRKDGLLNHDVKNAYMKLMDYSEPALFKFEARGKVCYEELHLACYDEQTPKEGGTIYLSPDEVKSISDRRLQELREQGIERKLTMWDFYTDEQIANNFRFNPLLKYNKLIDHDSWKPENYAIPENEDVIRELDQIVEDVNSMTAPEKIDREKLIQYGRRMQDIVIDCFYGKRYIDFCKKHGLEIPESKLERIRDVGMERFL